jgi:pre-rRNA-processing protein IPI1
MTNISQEVKDDGLNYMEWLLEVAGDIVISSAGCWVKPMKDFLSVLGWAAQTKPSTIGKSGWTSAPRTTFGAKKYGQSFPRQMTVLAKFLEAGFMTDEAHPWDPNNWLDQFTGLPKTPDPYGYLGLFKPPRDEDSETYRDRVDRQAIFHKRFRDAVESGVDMAKKEGGAAGRAAAVLDQVLRDGMGDYARTPRLDDDEHFWDGYLM